MVGRLALLTLTLKETSCDPAHDRLKGRRAGLAGTMLDKAFRIIAFDWDGTAVESRHHGVDHLLWRLEALLAADVILVIITGTNFDNIDRQFASLVNPELKHNLYVCTNRGSEVFGFDMKGRTLSLHRRHASPEEDAAMDGIALAVQRRLAHEYSLETGVVFDRLNRRKLDLIPVDEWRDPPKSKIALLLEAVERRLSGAGLSGGIRQVIEMVEEERARHGIDLRITTDVKHVEFGLTDKSDSVNWVLDALAFPAGVPTPSILFLGDEFGPIGGFEGSDYKMFSPRAAGAVYVSVGVEPGGVPEGVIHVGGGIPEFCRLMDEQIRLALGSKAAHGSKAAAQAQRERCLGGGGQTVGG